MVACRVEELSASTETMQSPRTVGEIPATPTSLVATLRSSLDPTIATQSTLVEPYSSTSQNSLPTLTPESREVLSTGSWIGLCVGVSIGVLLIVSVAVLFTLRRRRKHKDAKERYRGHVYPLKCIFDEIRVHNLLDLSRYRGLPSLT
ncbi:hypothetical protein P171DRAFT_431711 [Karstenula rhodostoma CBS 690.94]|uniref:Mid2 domain-containing protein n=1 Tax=Karstenula rhodostoma CBS 690.94 TaxID=1392251 RepID=A0A9P4PKE9_9PLEO|nr:hypothetical protein P171DRAFT_431711 [Karstenula rhodostoma CBS 690.94]